MAKKKIGIVGCGTIGSALARAVIRGFKKDAELRFLCDHRREKAEALKKSIRSRAAVVSLDRLLSQSDVIIEAASVHASLEILSRPLKPSQELMVMSVGGVPAAKNLKRMKARLWLPSGAVAGIDSVAGAREAGIRSTKLITRKPPAGLEQAPYFKTRRFPKLRGNNEEVRVFRGTARQAVKGFPQNINVAAILSLAGAGADKTLVEIWTSRAYRTNRHEIHVKSRAGTLHAVTDNVPSPDNPKTSALAIYSAIALLRKIFAQVRIGT
jgi:aspartate dehydrogenase